MLWNCGRLHPQASIFPAAKQRHKHASKPSLIVLPSATTKVLGGNSGPHFSSSAHVSNLMLLFFLQTLLPDDVQHADKLMCYFYRITLAFGLTRDKNHVLHFFLLILVWSLSVCLSAYIPAYLPLSLSVCPSVCLHIPQSVLPPLSLVLTYSSLSIPLFACLCVPLCFSVLPFPTLCTTPSVCKRFSLCLFFPFSTFSTLRCWFYFLACLPLFYIFFIHR